ncbi:MAG: hypothetical protein HS111_09955 [Kofleriaceae bacterium]|nr:hypothetical protein [Kofleriaceae bacterium]
MKWVFRASGGGGCQGASIPANLDEIDEEQLYDDHAAACPICGKRVPENLTGRLGRGIREVAISMFGPLAISEALVTCSLGLSVVSMSRGAAFALVGLTVLAVAGFLLLQMVAAGVAANRHALSVISPDFFRSPVVEVPPAERRTRLRRFVIGYLELARRAALATLLTYTSVAVGVAAVFRSPQGAILVAMAGLAWAVAFRARLGVVQPIALLDVGEDDRDYLYDVQRRSSRTFRLLSRTPVLDGARVLHLILISLSGGVSLVAHLANSASPTAAAGIAAVLVAWGALAQFWRWSTQQLKQERTCILVPQRT